MLIKSKFRFHIYHIRLLKHGGFLGLLIFTLYPVNKSCHQLVQNTGVQDGSAKGMVDHTTTPKLQGDSHPQYKLNQGTFNVPVLSDKQNSRKPLFLEKSFLQSVQVCALWYIS